MGNIGKVLIAPLKPKNALTDPFRLMANPIGTPIKRYNTYNTEDKTKALLNSVNNLATPKGITSSHIPAWARIRGVAPTGAAAAPTNSLARIRGT